MTKPTTAPYGSWRSPISADLVTGRTIGLGEVLLDGTDRYWIESRPTEGGRSVIVRLPAGGQPVEVTPAPYNARTRVHEYGGGSYTVAGGVLFFANFADQAVYRIDPGGEARPIFAEADLRHADFAPDLGRNRLICVREDHRVPAGQQPINTLVAIGIDGEPSLTLAQGHDFYASPCLSPDGCHLAWIAWNHPNMPWDGTELWLGQVGADGAISDARCIAGGSAESIFQPAWSPDGVLHFVSDRTGWWNLYRWEEGQARPLAPMAAEFGLPQWVFGRPTYGFAADGRIVASYTQDGLWHLAAITRAGAVEPIPLPYSSIAGVQVAGDEALFLAAAADRATAVVSLNLATGAITSLRESSEMAVDPSYLSIPQPISFPNQAGLVAHALYYSPQNPGYQAPAGERPPLIVLSHGGPTGSASSALNLAIQYWTSRGFAIADVNYGGSTGYGRAYRERLNGNWGIVDVDDCCSAARYLAEQGLVDADRLVIRGGSAGGYTTLAALTFRDLFKAGVSLYGIGDLEALVRDTHKFESHYLTGLVGPYPEALAVYHQRSPIHHVDQLACPVLFFQGLDDKVVPPNQAEAMVAALRAKGLPVAYVAFEGEGHGFRKAENNQRVLEGQLDFFGRLFGFTPADQVEPLAIENL